MALEDILRKIREDGEAEARKILDAAQVERAGILEAARDRGEAASTRILAAGEAAAGEIRRKELSTAGVEARLMALTAKQEVLGGVFDAALDRLEQMPDTEYRQLLADLAVNAAQTGDERVQVSERDAARLGGEWLEAVNSRLTAKGLRGNLQYAERRASIRGGLILQGTNVEVNCSFERTLASLRDQLEPEVAALLFVAPVQEAVT